jgi:uncharacterized protein (DUF1800 family)
MKINASLTCIGSFFSFLLSILLILGTVHRADAQPSTADTVRFLEQSTFGPTSSLIAHVQQVGFDAFLNEQLAAPVTDYPDLPGWPQTRPNVCTGTCARDNYTPYQLQLHFFGNALAGQDQLRQRVAFALSQIVVASFVDVPLPGWMRGYVQLLYSEGLGNFRQLLYDVTLNPGMGRFLNMLGNRCQTIPVNINICRTNGSSQPNENYAREILQLFSIGLFMLNPDGSRRVDASGNPIPTYDQKTVTEFARVFTGWINAAALPGPAASIPTVPNYRDPMVQHKSGQFEDWHDRGGKTLLNPLGCPGGTCSGGTQLAAGETADQDLNAAIDNVAFHPNVAPFISKQLIQHLVTSNPSLGYVQRIAAVFTSSQNSATQLFQVVSAILLDPEARGDSKDPTTLPNYGKLREPAQFITNILRAFNATSDGVLDSLPLTVTANGVTLPSPIGSADMNEDIFNAPSVFNFFPPTARVPGQNVLGPEFALFSSLTSLRRANFVNRVIFSTIPVSGDRPLGTSIDLSAWDKFATNPGQPNQLLDMLNQFLLHGTMSAEMRQSVLTAVTSIPNTPANLRKRVQTAIYLVLVSSQYQVQR